MTRSRLAALVIALAAGAGCGGRSAQSSDDETDPAAVAAARQARLLAQQDATLAGPADQHWYALPPDAPPDAASATGVVECDRYIDAMLQYTACPSIPQVARDAARQSIDAMRSAWTTANTDPTSYQAMASACKQGTDAFKQAASAMGCSITVP